MARESITYAHATSRASVTKAPPEGDARAELIQSLHFMTCSVGPPVNSSKTTLPTSSRMMLSAAPATAPHAISVTGRCQSGQVEAVTSGEN